MNEAISTGTGGDGSDQLEQVRQRLERERAARLESETLAERAMSELHAKVQDLEAANQTLRDFVAVASHDLRGPVSAVLGFASTLNKKWDKLSDPDKLEFLEIIERRGRFLSRMLDSLLTVSKIEAGALDVNREILSAEEVVERSLEDLSEERAAQVDVECPEGLKFEADPDHIQRILVNFMTNAFKYGAPPVRLEVRSVAPDVEFVVRDNGNGIPEDFEERLFHKFARAEVDGAHTERGAGLGLSIVQGLANANGGEAWYEANTPTGSCFGVRLPGTRSS